MISCFHTLAFWAFFEHSGELALWADSFCIPGDNEIDLFLKWSVFGKAVALCIPCTAFSALETSWWRKITRWKSNSSITFLLTKERSVRFRRSWWLRTGLLSKWALPFWKAWFESYLLGFFDLAGWDWWKVFEVVCHQLHHQPVDLWQSWQKCFSGWCPKMQELKNMRNEKLKDPPVEDTDEAPAKRRRGVECVVEVSMVPWSPCSARAKGHRWQMWWWSWRPRCSVLYSDSFCQTAWKRQPPGHTKRELPRRTRRRTEGFRAEKVVEKVCLCVCGPVMSCQHISLHGSNMLLWLKVTSPCGSNPIAWHCYALAFMAQTFCCLWYVSPIAQRLCLGHWLKWLMMLLPCHMKHISHQAIQSCCNTLAFRLKYIRNQCGLHWPQRPKHVCHFFWGQVAAMVVNSIFLCSNEAASGLAEGCK